MDGIGSAVTPYNVNRTGIGNGSETVEIGLENKWAAASVATLAIVGILANSGTILSVLCIKALKQQHFCHLYFVLSTSDVCFLLSNLLWSAPLIYFGGTQYGDWLSLRGSMVGLVPYASFHVSYFAQLSMALNRLMAIKYPLLCAKLYTPRNVRINCVGCVLFGLGSTAVFWSGDCSFYFDSRRMIWAFNIQTSCGYAYDFFCSVFCTTAILLVVAINLVTWYKTRQLRKNKVANRGGLNSQQQAHTYNQARRTRDSRFFVQTVINAVVYVTFTFAFHVFIRLSGSRWLNFIDRTILWECVPIVSGALFLCLNQEIRKAALYRHRCNVPKMLLKN